MQIFIKKCTSALAKGKRLIIVGVLSLSLLLSAAYNDNFFEISKNIDIFVAVFREININYVDQTKPGELVKTGIDAMLESLDPYTNFYPESEIEDYKFLTTGEYGGIGSLIREWENHVIITEPYEGFPAHKAGLMAGDKILKVDDKDVVGKESEEVSKMLKGASKTPLKLLIKRDNIEKAFEVTLTREDIKLSDVPYYGLLEDKVGYIKLNAFTNSCSKEVLNAYKELKKEHNIEALVFDLRGNGGGLLMEAVNIVNLFVEKGNEVVQTRGKLKEWDKTYRALNTPVDLTMPIVVIIDERSASASEIVAGSLQDFDRAVLIGKTTFGKGLVQNTLPLTYNSQMKVTVAKYYIPSGRCIQRLNYSDKTETGEAKIIPDSLKGEFKTRNGRKVFDGAGIDPDIVVEEEKPSNILRSLATKSLIFDFATLYRFKTDSIVPPKAFKVDDALYKNFVDFLEDKEYDYTTNTEKLLEELKKVTTKERYFDDISQDYEKLYKRVKHNKTEDLTTFKTEISIVLENELVSRYYYQKGRIESALKYDKNVQKALEILKDKQTYQSVLAGTYAKKD
jgi:carboxyl-terminal processing protease